MSMTNATRRQTYYRKHREEILAKQQTPEAREHVRQLHDQRKDEINTRRRELWLTKPKGKRRKPQTKEYQREWYDLHRVQHRG